MSILKKFLICSLSGAFVTAISLQGAGLVYAQEERASDDAESIVIECDTGDISEVKEALQDEGAFVEDVIEFNDKTFIKASSDSDISQVEEELAEKDFIQDIEPERKFKLMATDVSSLNDTYKDSLWHFNNINAGGAWDVLASEPSRTSVKVAVIDSGIEKNHEDLKGIVEKNICMILGDKNYGKDTTEVTEAHGTQVAGVLGAISNNSKGVAGIASYKNSIIKITGFNVCKEEKDYDGSFITTASDTDIAAAIKYAVDKEGCRVINLSMGSYAKADVLEAACKYAYEKGCVICCASGNTSDPEDEDYGPTRGVWPADYDTTVSVIAVTYGSDKNTSTSSYNFLEANKANASKNKRAYYSTYGNEDICAPGNYITTSSTGGSYKISSGTSFAAPQVSAVAAMILSIRPELGAGQVKDILTSTATDNGASGYDKETAYGTVNAAAAVTLAKTIEKDGWRKTNGSWYYYKAGKAYTGWHYMGTAEKEKTPHWSYFGNDGKLRTGWVQLGKGTNNPDGNAAKHWSYFGDNGWLRTGWQKMGTSSNPDGKNKEHWSYFGDNGWLRTGWQKMGISSNPDGKNKEHWSYFGDNGWLRTGWVQLGKGTNNPDGNAAKHWSYFGDNGWLRTGWVQLGKGTKEPDGNKAKHWSYFGSNGWLRTGWVQLGKGTKEPDGNAAKHWSYFGDNGWLRTGRHQINGKSYLFDYRGWLSGNP